MHHLASLRFVIIAALMLCCSMTTAVAFNKKALLLNPSRDQVDSILCILDEEILHKGDYQKRRIARADSLVKAASHKSGKERIAALKDAYTYYSHVSGKKSMAILDQMTRLPEYNSDRDLKLWVTDCRGYIYSVMGMFHRSYELLHEINVDGYDRPARMHHYDTMYQVLSWINSAFCNEGSLLPSEKAAMKQYNDSLITYNNDATSIVFAEVAHEINERNYDNALKKLVTLYYGTSGQEETYVYAQMCDVFVGKKDTLALTYYFAKTSINDIKDGTTEYMCLPVLVQYLFNEGDIDRAYNYLKCCLEDAYLYPSQYLISQTTNIFPIVDKQYQTKKAEFETGRRTSLIITVCAICLAIIIVILAIYLYHRHRLMRRLKHINSLLADTNKDLAHANNVKDIFLHNMTHELHTPMNAIDGFAQLLDDNEGHIDDVSRKEMTTAIRNSSHQLNMLIDNIIMLTEYENTRVETKMERINVNDIYASLKQQVYNTRAGQVDIIYKNNIPDDFVIMSSGVHITTIILNLIDNALKFTHTGTVTVLASLGDEGHVVFRVIDTGVGIPADKKETVFDRFSKLNEFAQGAGLGLPLCHTLTTMIGGKIRIERSDSNGTTINVTLPAISK